MKRVIVIDVEEINHKRKIINHKKKLIDHGKLYVEV